MIAHVATVEANCSLQTSLLVYMALVVGVSSVVLWWNGASQLVYMALVVRVSSVLLWWKRDSSSRWLLSSELLWSSCALVVVGRLVLSGNMSSCVLLCGWWRGDSTCLYCWMGLLGWVFGAACCDSFAYRYHSLNYFCCPFLSSELSVTDIFFAWRRIKEVSLWRCVY